MKAICSLTLSKTNGMLTQAEEADSTSFPPSMTYIRISLCCAYLACLPLLGFLWSHRNLEGIAESLRYGSPKANHLRLIEGLMPDDRSITVAHEAAWQPDQSGS